MEGLMQGRDEAADRERQMLDWMRGGGAVIVQGGPRTPYLVIDTHPPHAYTALSKPSVDAAELARLKSLAPQPEGHDVILYCKAHDRVTWYIRQNEAKADAGPGYCDQC
jgi:hypothetical protein